MISAAPGRSLGPVVGSADKPEAEPVPPAPNDLAAARRRPGHESDIQPAPNFHGCIDGDLRAAWRNILDRTFVIGGPVIQRDPRRLMSAPANLAALDLELRPCFLVHAVRLRSSG
jgi:hypothetical protein